MMRSDWIGQFVAFAFGRIEILVRLVVAGKDFLLRIPLQPPSQPAGDVAQMAQGGHAMRVLDVHDRVFPGGNAVVEVLHVVVALVNANRIGGERILIEALRMALVPAAKDRDPALVADEDRPSSDLRFQRAEGHHDAVGILVVALTAAILAAFAAVTALYAEHFATEAMLEQIQASDTWSEFQANSIKEKVIETKKEVLTILKKEPDPEDEAKLLEYKEHKTGLKEKAEEKERESIKHLREHVPLSRGLTLFQVAIAIGAISVLTKRRAFWFVSITFGVIGTGFLAWGLVT